MISTSKGPYVLVPIFDKSTVGMSAILYSVRDFEVAKILFVTDSGAGAPFVRLYLMPKSALGPVQHVSQCVLEGQLIERHPYRQGCDWQ